MEWVIVAIIGAVIGTVVSFAAIEIRMPQILTIAIGTVGALAGGFLAYITHFYAFGTFSFYVAGTGLAIALVAGSVLGFSLTNEEKRI